MNYSITLWKKRGKNSIKNGKKSHLAVFLGQKLGNEGVAFVLRCADIALGLVEQNIGEFSVFHRAPKKGNRVRFGVDVLGKILLRHSVDRNAAAARYWRRRAADNSQTTIPES